jgi:hypothetical protein
MLGECAFPGCVAPATKLVQLHVPKSMHAFIDFPGEFDFGACEKHSQGAWIIAANKESVLEINARMKGAK